MLLLQPSFSNFFPQSRNKEVAALEQGAFSKQPGDPSVLGIWEKILELDPKNSNARIQLGLFGMTSPDKEMQREAFNFLQDAFDPDKVRNVIPMPSHQGIILASVIGRYRIEEVEYNTAEKFLKIAFDSMKMKTGQKDVCLELQMATMLNPFPESMERKQESVDKFQQRLEKFLNGYKNKDHVQLDEDSLRKNVPGAGKL